MDRRERALLTPSGLFDVASVDVLQHDRREADVGALVVGVEEAEPVRVREALGGSQAARILGDLAEVGAGVDLAQPGEGSKAAQGHRQRPAVGRAVRAPGEFDRSDLGLAVAREVAVAFGYPEVCDGDRIPAVAGADLVERAGRHAGHLLSYLRRRRD